MIYYRNLLFTNNVHELISRYMFLLCYNCVKYGHITSKEQVSFHSKYSLGEVLSSEAGGSGLTWENFIINYYLFNKFTRRTHNNSVTFNSRIKIFRIWQCMITKNNYIP